MELNKYLTETKQDKVSRFFVNRRYYFIDRYLKNVKRGKSLDIGSNYGLFTELLKKKGYSSYGIEVDKKMVRWARKNGKAKYLLGGAEKIPFKNNTFDVVILLSTLEHIADRCKVLKEINRVLKPGGKAIITIPNTWSYYFLRTFFTYLIRYFFQRWRKPAWRNVHYQQNYFHWEHQIHQFLKIVDWRPILAIPFVEPKLISQDSLADYEYKKKGLAWMSAEPIIITTKRQKEIGDNYDNTSLK